MFKSCLGDDTNRTTQKGGHRKMTIADELIARRDFVAFSENWVTGHPKYEDQECLLYRCVSMPNACCRTVMEHTVSQETYRWLVGYCQATYNLTPITINDRYPKEFLLEVLDAAILAAKEAEL